MSSQARGKAIRTISPAVDPATSQLLINLRTLVDVLALNDEVVSALLPSGRPYDFESQLWDYKEKFPTLPDKPTEVDRKQHKAELGDIIKDVVAFHNAFGGYIVFEVKDKGKERVPGCSGEFDCGDFNKRLEGYTGVSIECLFRITPASSHDGSPHIGLLLVPRRPTGASPVRFRKKGPEKLNGNRCFSDETYIRIRDECRPATATSEDWLFLHSDRSPPEAQQWRNRRPVSASLPARDPDLVEFVGREDTLALLRAWLSDPRSPVRLVTGIGGLGKTTIAYRFAEEVVESGASGVEWVIWLTAKRKTYSALRGQLVQTGRVDFNNLAELYGAILKALSHELGPGEDEPTLCELADRVVDALYNYTCLIIVDDIDSLSPDEQKETVAALNGIALRTVGREIPASRILMTSRIDLGMPPTAVLKISGLKREDFDKYVANLCSTYSIRKIVDKSLDTLFLATSGSPLFTASIVRLVSLGDNLDAAIEEWKGQEGEEVRKFAFEREIHRLDGPQGRLLYAVLLLEETSLNDLANVLEVTPKVVRDRISELQAYHLISTATKEGGDAVIFAPSDLSVVTEILRSHLGSQAASIEKSCARAQARSSNDNRSIGAGIRRIVGAWEARRPDEALQIAKELQNKFPKSGDVANILGQALLRLSPPQSRDADREFDTARRLGCSRPELIADAICTKIELRDWQGLLEMTAHLSSNDASRDLPLDGYLRACAELVDIAKTRGDYNRVAELAIGAVEKISLKFSRLRLDRRQFDELKTQRFRFAHEYISALGHNCPRPGDKLVVFDGIWRLAETDVVLVDLVRLGLSALQAWWGDVETRPIVDQTACRILNRQLSRLERLERQLTEYGRSQSPVLTELSHSRLELAHKGARICV